MRTAAFRALVGTTALIAGLCIGTGTAAAAPSAPFDPHLTRAPYLTDLVGRHVAVNFATDRSGTTAAVTYAPVVGDGSCTPSTSVTASRKSITVGTVSEYQWKVDLDLPSTGTYCYRAYLGTTDLLGTNVSPQLTTQVPVGSGESFSFDVMGDWGLVDSAGANANQANALAQVAASGARFLVTVGDNGYPNGSQINYGDLQQTGSGTSGIFGPQFWTVPGATVPIFPAVGNHGLAGTAHTDITTWTQATAVSTSGGRYQDDIYCCVNGTSSAHYGSEWYAFSAGNTRFYVLDSAWSDSNSGTASPYANDVAAHFVPGAPEYEWLVNDLQTHPAQLKFVFSHYPAYADNPTEGSDPYLQGAGNLEGLLAKYGAQLWFNGHMHGYQRNKPSAPGMPITYVTGGGGATLEPVGPCTAIDAYAIGWSPSKSKGSACGSATAPTSAARVYHFLKVTVTGNSVTVAPTDSLGNTFDVQTYTFIGPPETYLDSAPPSATNSDSATFSFHASDTAATFACSLDGAAATACASPVTYTGLAEGSHKFAVAATIGTQTDPTPAQASWAVDRTPPTAPTGLAASATTATEVDLTWSASTDNTGVSAYDVFRNGTRIGTVNGSTTAYRDTSVAGGTSYSYAVGARDAVGNASGLSGALSVTTPNGTAPIFANGFENGNLSAWTSNAGLVVETGTVRSGIYAAEGNTTNGGTFAKKTLPSTYPDAYARVGFRVLNQAAQINLLRMRTAAGTSIGYVYLDTSGRLGVHLDTTGANTISSVTPDTGWHMVELHLGIAAGTIEVWLDGTAVAALAASGANLGTTNVGAFQIGEVQTGRTYDVVFDDAAFGTGRLGTV
jgi:hypothetical protein